MEISDTRISRNDPCPCGSGKKYKKCCMFKDRPAAGPQELARSRFVYELGDFAFRKLHEHIAEAYAFFWRDENPGDHLPPEYRDFTTTNFNEWFLFDYPIDQKTQRTVVDFFRENLKTCSADENYVLEAFKESVLSLYEVQEVELDKGFVLRDLLMRGDYQVWEKSGTQSLVKWDILAARLLFIDGKYVISGSVYPFPAKDKKDILSDINRAYKYYKKENRRGTWKSYLKAAGTIFNDIWLDYMKMDRVPAIRTTTGEPFIFSTAIFGFERDKRQEIIRKLDTVDKFFSTPDEPDAFTWSEDPGRDGATVLGSIRVLADTLTLECMSKKRLSVGKKLLQDSLPALLTHKSDTFNDPHEMLESIKDRPVRQDEDIPLEIRRQIYDKFMREHMTKWLDEEIPALDGRTPRECVKTPAGRRKVADLLISFENIEECKKSAGEPSIDLGWVWQALNLKRPE